MNGRQGSLSAGQLGFKGAAAKQTAGKQMLLRLQPHTQAQSSQFGNPRAASPCAFRKQAGCLALPQAYPRLRLFFIDTDAFGGSLSVSCTSIKTTALL